MKKFKSLLLLISMMGIILIPLNCSAKVVANIAKDHGLFNLKTLQIIQYPEKWKSEDLLTRRDMFKLCYVAKMAAREHYFTYAYSVEKETVLYTVVQPDLEGRVQVTEYMDIEEGSEDYYLMVDFLIARLLLGEETENGYIAGFDEYATYGDALGALIRVLTPYEYGQVYVPKDGKSFLDDAEEIGLVNCDFPITGPDVIIQPEELNENITVGEFTYLLDKILYVQTVYDTRTVSPYYLRRVDPFLSTAQPPLYSGQKDDMGI